MTLINCILAVLVSAVVASTAVTTPEPEHDPATRTADMADMGIASGYTAAAYTFFDIPLSDDFQMYVTDVCDTYGLDVRIVYGVMWQESRFTPDAIGDHGQSFGMCQIKRKWHEDRIARLGVTDLLDPHQNVLVACDYLAELLGVYGSYEKALTVYRYGDLNITAEDYAKVVMTQAYSFIER